MPRLAIISDVHANLEALRAVLIDIDQAGYDHLLCLGDVVGYGPDPSACVEIVYDACDEIVIGNHDEAALGEDAGPFNEFAAQGVSYTRAELSPVHRLAVSQWSQRVVVAGVTLTHACFGPNPRAYLSNEQIASIAFEALPTRIGVVGHTHIPTAFACAVEDRVRPSVSRLPTGQTIPLAPSHRFLLNPGAVGQPRDRNPLAAWAILDTKAGTFQVRRVSYDIETTQRKIREAGLPDFLSDRLARGA